VVLVWVGLVALSWVRLGGGGFGGWALYGGLIFRSMTRFQVYRSSPTRSRFSSTCNQAPRAVATRRPDLFPAMSTRFVGIDGGSHRVGRSGKTAAAKHRSAIACLCEHRGHRPLR